MLIGEDLKGELKGLELSTKGYRATREDLKGELKVKTAKFSVPYFLSSSEDLKRELKAPQLALSILSGISS